MKTKNLTSVIVILFSVFYTAKANQVTIENKSNIAFEDSSMTNHNHNCSSMMENNSSMMNQSDSTMMGHGNMMAMMQKCQSLCDKMGNVKSDNSFVDPGTKKSSYGYFQYQRQKDNAGKEKK
ncbi:MAG: hypothetical protein M1480_05645 [Bacteroidetes bacterium]|nr:hypothetical protein [Bacteroidota bacterium]